MSNNIHKSSKNILRIDHTMPTMNTSRRSVKRARLSVPVPMMSSPVKKARLSVPIPTMSSPIKKARLSGEVPMPTTKTSGRLIKKARLSREVPMWTVNTSRKPIKKARLSGEFRDEIQRKRASARIQMQNMKASVVIDENKDIMKELEILSFGSSRRAMEQLGLFLKDDYIEEEDYDDGDAKDTEHKEKCCESSGFDEETSPNDLSAAAAAVEANVSTKKAMCVAMLKSGFADTIFKATHQMVVLSQSHKTHPQRKLQEMERLETEQLKEKANTKAAIKPLSRREQIQTERAAARNALQKMEASVVIDENKDITKELEMLSSGSSRRLMEQLGLFLKDEDYGEDSLFEEAEHDHDEDLLLEVEEAELIF